MMIENLKLPWGFSQESLVMSLCKVIILEALIRNQDRPGDVSPVFI